MTIEHDVLFGVAILAICVWMWLTQKRQNLHTRFLLGHERRLGRLEIANEAADAERRAKLDEEAAQMTTERPQR